MKTEIIYKNEERHFEHKNYLAIGDAYLNGIRVRGRSLVGSEVILTMENRLEW